MKTSDDSSKGVEATPLIAVIAAASKDICFHLDSDGTILDHQGGAVGSALLEPFLGKRLPGLLPPEVTTAFDAGLSRAIEGGETTAIEFNLSLTTEILTFQARLIPFSSGKVVAIIRRRPQEITRLVEERFHTIFLNTSAGMVLVAPDETFIEVNPAFCHFLGYTADELLKLTVEEITHPDDREESRRLRVEVATGKTPMYTLEKRYRRKDGDTVWGHVSTTWIYGDDGTPICSVALIQDITERKHMEEALGQSEERYRYLYNETPVMLHSIDRDGRLLSVSNYWLEVLGYVRSEVLGRMSAEFLTEASRRYAEEVVLPEYYKTGLCQDVPYQIVTKGGKILEVLLSATAERDDSGRIIRSLAVTIDITERKLAEEKIEKLNADLEARAAELEAANQEMEAFNYTVAHDLRGPLNITGLYFQTILALYGAKLDESCREYLTKGNKSTQHMSQLIDVLLAFSKLSHVEPHREMVDLSAVALEVAGELQLTSPERRGTFQVADGIKAEGDPKLIRLVLGNLIGNAWKYTGMREEAIIDFGMTEVDGKTAYFVRDNGAGFDNKNATTLFIPFQRLHGPAQFKGFGIGLATVERIIRRHGGRIWAEGKPGSGATFYFILGGDEDRVNSPPPKSPFSPQLQG